MGRKTKQNKITSPELLAQVNPDNRRLVEDFLIYLKSIQRSPTTLAGYLNDLNIFFVWNLQNNRNKHFVELTKRDIVSYQNWLLTNNENSPARVRRLKSTLSSLSNYIENILDQEHQGFRPIIRKIESPPSQATRKKTVLSEKQVEWILEELVKRKQYDKACCFALASFSGRRKKELLRFKTSFFTDENILYGSLYKSPEEIQTKGRGLGKYIPVYVLANKFKPYFELWMEKRKEIGIESEWLFPLETDPSQSISADRLTSWALTFSNMLGVDFYWHSLRHYFTTQLCRSGLPDSVIVSILGWSSPSMIPIYRDIPVDEEFAKYFDENGVKTVENTRLSDL